MKHLWLTLILLLSQLNGMAARENIIYETDMGNDIDDALALDMLYKQHLKGKINLMAVMLNKEGIYPAEYIDILNTWYGVRKMPIGLSSRTTSSINVARNYTQAVCEMKNSQGLPLYKRSGRDCSQLPLASKLYRKILSRAEGNSVTIVSVGFSTNLALLLRTAGDDYSPLSGEELVKQKVKRLVMMAGHMENPNYAEYNVVNDVPSCQMVFDKWPTPIIMSPYELAEHLKYPGRSIQEDFGWTKHHPIVDAYKVFLPKVEDRPTWDLTAVLYALEGNKYFGESPAGTITVTDKGYTHFLPSPNGRHHYLTTTQEQRDGILQHFLKIIPCKP